MKSRSQSCALLLATLLLVAVALLPVSGNAVSQNVSVDGSMSRGLKRKGKGKGGTSTSSSNDSSSKSSKKKSKRSRKSKKEKGKRGNRLRKPDESPDDKDADGVAEGDPNEDINLEEQGVDREPPAPTPVATWPVESPMDPPAQSPMGPPVQSPVDPPVQSPMVAATATPTCLECDDIESFIGSGGLAENYVAASSANEDRQGAPSFRYGPGSTRKSWNNQASGSNAGYAVLWLISVFIVGVIVGGIVVISVRRQSQRQRNSVQPQELFATKSPSATYN